MKCKTCGKKVPHKNKTGRLSKWDVIKAGEAGWFFQRDGTAWCPNHVPEWVESWRERQKEAEKNA